MRARLATEVGTRLSLRVYAATWIEGVDKARAKCPAQPGEWSYHEAREPILETWMKRWRPEDRRDGDPRWPKACAHCGEAWDELAAGLPAGFLVRQAFTSKLYDTPSGDLEPGCLYWADWEHLEEPVAGRIIGGRQATWAAPTACLHGWSNCDGRHLMAILPNGACWTVDGRASNCNAPHDQEHRCWVRTGDPPALTVGKHGRTCSAGAGSISAPGWHGFLVDGAFVLC